MALCCKALGDWSAELEGTSVRSVLPARIGECASGDCGFVLIRSYVGRLNGVHFDPWANRSDGVSDCVPGRVTGTVLERAGITASSSELGPSVCGVVDLAEWASITVDFSGATALCGSTIEECSSSPQ